MQTASEDFFEIRLPTSEKTVRVKIKHSARCRRLTLKIKNPDEIIAVVPTHLKNYRETAHLFALKNLDWLDRQLKKIETSALAGTPAPATLLEYLVENPQIFIGENAQIIEISQTSLRPFFILRENSEVLPICVRESCREADLLTLVRKIAAQILPARVRELATQCDITIGEISVRNQHSRWGSCTTKGNLSFNWRLVLLPPKIRDHVILHELAHRRHMNHSDNFWDLLYLWDPQTQAHNQELAKTWSKILMRF